MTQDILKMLVDPWSVPPLWRVRGRRRAVPGLPEGVRVVSLTYYGRPADERWRIKLPEELKSRAGSVVYFDPRVMADPGTVEFGFLLPTRGSSAVWPESAKWHVRDTPERAALTSAFLAHPDTALPAAIGEQWRLSHPERAHLDPTVVLRQLIGVYRAWYEHEHEGIWPEEGLTRDDLAIQMLLAGCRLSL